MNGIFEIGFATLIIIMTNEIIKKYGIDFQNRVDDGKIDKFPGAHEAFYITDLLFEWNSVDDINDGLLKDIEEALADSNSEIEAGSTVVDIIIYQNVVQFYPRWREEESSMPTADLKEIITAWRDFLLTPPLNGSSIYSPLNIGYWALAKIKKAR
nr:hypothetical protein [uncultured Mucilaginibacter sp.]